MKLPTERGGDGDDKSNKKKPNSSNSSNGGGKKAPEVPPGLEHFHSKYPKPTHSYSYLITTAILESLHQQMTLNEIYEWVMERYPWYRTAINGWKVSRYCGEFFFFFFWCPMFGQVFQVKSRCRWVVSDGARMDFF